MLNPSQKENALALFEKGVSKRAISRQLGVSHTTVNKWVNSHASNKSQKNGNFLRRVETPEKSALGRIKVRKEEGSLLDTVTGNSATPTQTVLRENESEISLKTGEISPISSYNSLIKWELQHASRSILGPSHRVDQCCMRIRPDFLKAHRDIEVRGGLGRKPYYVGLLTCGLVWICPVCAAKIQAYRALEVRAVIDDHLEKGGSVWMITQTIPHTRFDNLEGLISRFSKAFQSFKSNRKWRAIKSGFDISGYIKALEVTWSAEFGWHPHLHTIFFLDQERKDVDVPAFCAALFAQWQNCTARQGFGELSRKAFSVQDASKVKEYLNKMTGERYVWGSEHEITRLHSKKGRRLSYAPFDFLRVYNGSSLKNSIDAVQAADLFRTYAAAFFGRMHLTYSKGLERPNRKTDEEIAQSLGEVDLVLATITRFQWRQLLKLPEKAWHGELLRVVEDFGPQGLKYYLESKGVTDQEKEYDLEEFIKVVFDRRDRHVSGAGV